MSLLFWNVTQKYVSSNLLSYYSVAKKVKNLLKYQIKDMFNCYRSGQKVLIHLLHQKERNDCCCQTFNGQKLRKIHCLTLGTVNSSQFLNLPLSFSTTWSGVERKEDAKCQSLRFTCLNIALGDRNHRGSTRSGTATNHCPNEASSSRYWYQRERDCKGRETSFLAHFHHWYWEWEWLKSKNITEYHYLSNPLLFRICPGIMQGMHSMN